MEIPGRRIISGEVVYTPWITRGGDSVILRGETIDSSGGGMVVDVTVETRSEEDVSGFSTLTGTSALQFSDTAGFYQGMYLSGTSTGVKEQIRLKLEGSGGETSDWTLLRIFQPLFFDGALAS